MEGLDIGMPGIEGMTEIGSGGFARVYRAHDTTFGRDVAVKVLHTRVGAEGADTTSERTLQRFQRECLAMGAVAGHPGIVTVHTSGVTPDGHPFLVMGFEAGGSLQDRLDRGGPMPWREVAEIGAALADALQAAHDAGVLHRDVKPANVLVSSYGTVKLSDFGIARVTGASHTTSKVITASIVHAAPEVLEGRDPLPQSDVYSLGSTLCTLLSGTPPFAGGDDLSLAPLIARIVTSPVPDHRPLGVPDDFQRVLEAAMAKDPTDRLPSASALATALRDVLAGSPTGRRAQELTRPAPPPLPPAEGGPPDGDPGRPRGRGQGWLVGLLLTLLLAATVAGAMALTAGGDGGGREDPSPPPTVAGPPTDPGTPPANDGGTSPPPAPAAELAAALLVEGDLGGEWTPQPPLTDDPLAEYGLCARTLDTSAVQAQHSSTLQRAGTLLDLASSAVARFDDAAAAAATFATIRDATSCETFEEPTAALGDVPSTILERGDLDVGDEAFRLAVRFDTAITPLETDIAVARSGRHLVTMELPRGSHDIGSLLETVVDRLPE